MSFFAAAKLALKGILANKVRSFLTMLGVIIGVFTVIILVSVGKGATASVTENISSMGSNLISLSIIGQGAKTSLNEKDIGKIAALEGVAGISPTLNQSVDLKYATSKTEGISLVGVTADYAAINNRTVSSGRFILPVDLANRQKVALVGTTVVADLFGGDSPLGKNLEVDGVSFRVIGILESKGSSGREDQDETVLVPLTTAQRLYQDANYRSLSIQVAGADQVDAVMGRLETLLAKIFRDQEGNAYRIFNQAELLSTISEVTGTLTLMLGGIAGISLLVGGIGIMNIMLVTVTERTREIGIRKSLGAKRRDILTQFLIESIVISGLGGLLGIAFGWGGSRLLTSLAGINTVVNLDVILLAFAFAVFVGIFFGIYPANKAAKLNPIEALRSE